MRQFKHIQARPSAFALGLMILPLALVPSGSIAQTDKTDAKAHMQPASIPASFEGCYELKVGRWWPWSFGEDNALVAPPSRIQLLGERGTRGFEKDKLLVRSIPQKERPSESRGSSFWSMKSANQLLLTWTDGFVGVTLDLTKGTDEMNGWAHPQFDAVKLVPRVAHVTARRIACPTQ